MEFVYFVALGFFAQLVDGALGMAYGVISMSVLLGMGIPPSAASASIHAAEVVTSGVSGLSHAIFKNIDYVLLRRLLIPGMVGSIIGAYLVTQVSEETIKPIIASYLLVMGSFTIYRAVRKAHWMDEVRRLIYAALKKEKPAHQFKRVVPLGVVGGFCDAVGGGGWGSIVNATLLAQGDDEPRYSVGTTSLTEFLVALSSSVTFFILIGLSHWKIVVGLIAGGVIAAPFSAIVIRYIPARVLMIFAGSIILLVSTATFIKLLFF